MRLHKKWLPVWATAILIAYAGTAHAIEVAGELFVDLNAAAYDGGNIWENPGTYSDFEADGTPIAGMINESPAVIFDGASAFFGEDFAPDGLVGFDPTRSIEVWAYNPNIASEETLVSWGKRGGPEGSNMAFNYGNHGKFGAVGHWGGDNHDVGWIDNGPNDVDEPGDWTAGAPNAGEWHHLVYTFDEEYTRVYANGELWNEEDMTQYGGLDTHVDTGIAIASQWEADGVTLTGNLRGSLAIGQVRIHDEVLSSTQILSNYNEEVVNYPNPLPPAPPTPEAIPAGPIHRYSFGNPAAGDATDAVISDSVGGANGVVLGEGSSFDGNKLSLDGGGSDFAAYVDLPNGLISALTDVTIESWVTIEGVHNWARVFDFGSTSPGGEDGELDDVGGGGEGLDYFLLSASRGTESNLHRVEIRNEDPAGGGATTIDFSDNRDLPKEALYTVVYDSDGSPAEGPLVSVYVDGEKVTEGTTNIALSDINDVNNWLGRSNWTNDSNLEGSYDEFRIYDYALTENQVLGNFEAGAESVNIGVKGDVNGDGVCNAADIDAIAEAVRTGDMDLKYDLDGNGAVEAADRTHLITELKNTYVGDSNLDGEFSSSDFVAVFGAGEYEDATVGNSGWADGDWNGDGDFTSGDFVAAFSDGGYEKGPRPAAQVPEPSTAPLLLLGIFSAIVVLRRR